MVGIITTIIFTIIVTFHAGKMDIIVIIFIVTYLESLDGHHHHNFHVIVKIVIMEASKVFFSLIS